MKRPYGADRGLGIALLLLLFNTLRVGAQVVDDFSDGDFSQNPRWTGDSVAFVINGSGQLQLVAPVAGTFSLSTPFSRDLSAGTTEWRFIVRASFAPSTGNYPRIYLSSDKQNLSSPLNGYYFQIGETGNLDGLDLYKQTGATSTLILNGLPNSATTYKIFAVRVTRSPTGVWDVYADSTGDGTNLTLQGTTTDAIHTLSSYFGVNARVTSSNLNKIYWDDFYAGPLLEDLTPPTIDEVTAIDDRTVEVRFSERVTLASAQQSLNYDIFPTNGSPISAALNSDGRTVSLILGTPLTSGVTYTLTATDIVDLAGNTQSITALQFTYTSSVGDVARLVITELFPDPSPIIGLPDAEFIEIYNADTFTVNLLGWTIRDASTTVSLPLATIAPGEYGIVIGAKDTAKFKKYGTLIPVTSLSTLNNDGDVISILAPDGSVTSRVPYTLAWYNNSAKEDGGYTLERKDPIDECGGKDNWQASNDTSGGTPGRQNSVFGLV